jgi:hypothetical protein
MNLCGTLVANLVANTDGPCVPAERLSHPKDGALAQQLEAERAPHSAVVRPQAAGNSRSTTSEPIDRFVSCGASGNLGLNWTGTVGHFAHCWPRFELKECWFEPKRRMGSLRRGSQRFLVQHFLVQDGLRASDVLHRDWDWSRWL